ncbi:MAG: M67 family metallopeptidase [Gemmatimonadetes bacterium]|nr:M67 family metallopeptidase [Gemmatimonadota bacterium]
MTLVLEPRHLTAVRRHGEAEYPHEACGIVGGTVEGERRIAVDLVPVRNARGDASRNRYLIGAEAFRRAEARLARDGLEIIGVYHSHPNSPPVPSAFDREHAWPRLSYLIVGVALGNATDQKSWVLADDRAAFAEEPLAIEEGRIAWQSPS